MNVLIVGNGAREHALAWKIQGSPLVKKIFVAPGNGGTSTIAENIPIKADDLPGLLQCAIDHSIDITIVGPETPLSMGIVDLFQQHNLSIFGPSQEASKIESSKVFCKNLMRKYNIPTGYTEVFESYQEALDYAKAASYPVVIKADGLASGKGVTIADNLEQAIKAIQECLVDKVFGDSGNKILIEEYLVGQEVSVFTFSDGTHISSLISACDYKRAHDGDQGPNTGGMGSYTPPIFWTDELERQINQAIMEPTIEAMSKEGTPFKGILYAGLMLTNEGPKVLEFNCRLGDPETQVILPRLDTDLIEIIMSIINGQLTETAITWNTDAYVGIVIASQGYPGHYTTGTKINAIGALTDEELIFHSGTTAEQGNIYTDGGRVLTVVGRGNSVQSARDKAYEHVRTVDFPGAFYRTDIGIPKQN